MRSWGGERGVGFSPCRLVSLVFVWLGTDLGVQIVWLFPSVEPEPSLGLVGYGGCGWLDPLSGLSWEAGGLCTEGERQRVLMGVRHPSTSLY